jgi:hypothetical protein
MGQKSYRFAYQGAAHLLLQSTSMPALNQEPCESNAGRSKLYLYSFDIPTLSLHSLLACLAQQLRSVSLGAALVLNQNVSLKKRLAHFCIPP